MAVGHLPNVRLIALFRIVYPLHDRSIAGSPKLTLSRVWVAVGIVPTVHSRLRFISCCNGFNHFAVT